MALSTALRNFFEGQKNVIEQYAPPDFLTFAVTVGSDTYLFWICLADGPYLEFGFHVCKVDLKVEEYLQCEGVTGDLQGLYGHPLVRDQVVHLVYSLIVTEEIVEAVVSLLLQKALGEASHLRQHILRVAHDQVEHALPDTGREILSSMGPVKGRA